VCVAEILKANDEVIKVMALYEDINNKVIERSLLVDASYPSAAGK